MSKCLKSRIFFFFILAACSLALLYISIFPKLIRNLAFGCWWTPLTPCWISFHYLVVWIKTFSPQLADSQPKLPKVSWGDSCSVGECWNRPELNPAVFTYLQFLVISMSASQLRYAANPCSNPSGVSRVTAVVRFLEVSKADEGKLWNFLCSLLSSSTQLSSLQPGRSITANLRPSPSARYQWAVVDNICRERALMGFGFIISPTSCSTASEFSIPVCLLSSNSQVFLTSKPIEVLQRHSKQEHKYHSCQMRVQSHNVPYPNWGGH